MVGLGQSLKASKNLEAMKWEEFRELYIGKYFPASTQHAKAREFLEQKQETMTVLGYVTKFIKFAHFVDDYAATDMAKVRKFEDGLKLSIWGKIVGLFLLDKDLMVKIATRHETSWRRGLKISEGFGLRG